MEQSTTKDGPFCSWKKHTIRSNTPIKAYFRCSKHDFLLYIYIKSSCTWQWCMNGKRAGGLGGWSNVRQSNNASFHVFPIIAQSIGGKCQHTLVSSFLYSHRHGKSSLLCHCCCFYHWHGFLLGYCTYDPQEECCLPSQCQQAWSSQVYFGKCWLSLYLLQDLCLCELSISL